MAGDVVTRRMFDATGRTAREVNTAIRDAAGAGDTILIENPNSMHNLAVALQHPVRVLIDGPAGSYAAGMNCGAMIEVNGSAGYGTAENMEAGVVVVAGNANFGTGASMRGGLLYVKGNTSARTCIQMKGGTCIVGGDTGFMTGFMMQRGRLVVLGNAGDGTGDSMYEGEVYVAGDIDGLGTDTRVLAPEEGELADIKAALAQVGAPYPETGFRKIVSARQLWNYSKHEWEAWAAI